MLALRDVQAAFGRALIGGEEPAVAALVADDGLGATARLAIYGHHVRSTLTSVLEGAYPVVRQLVDPRFFAFAADRYVRAVPPAGPCLWEYGATFADFLAGFPPCASLPYLPDVARLEWALGQALHAGDAPALAPEVLRALPPDAYPSLVLRLDPSVSYLASPWPVDRIWRAHQPGADSAAPVDLGAGPAHIEIRRDGDDVTMRSLDAATHALRQALHAGRSLATAAEAALGCAPGFDLAAAFRDVLAEALVVGATVVRSDPLADIAPSGPITRASVDTSDQMVGARVARPAKETPAWPHR